MRRTRVDWIKGGELRWQTIGRVGAHRLVLAAHAIFDDAGVENHPVDIGASRLPPRAQKGVNMQTKLVSHTLETLPLRTSEDKARLDAPFARPDSEIEWTADDFRKAVRGGCYRPAKAQVAAKLDKDVLAWLKADGKGYKTRMNAILRRAMLRGEAALPALTASAGMQSPSIPPNPSLSLPETPHALPNHWPRH